MAARVFVPKHYREIFRFVRRRVPSVEEAEDATQEVFADAVTALERSQAEAPPNLAWLYTVARRRIIDQARRRVRAQTVSLDAEALSNEEAEYGTLVARSLSAGLATMPVGQRDVVVGRLLRGRSFAELGHELDVSEEACRMRFMRGLRHLREEFEKEGLSP